MVNRRAFLIGVAVPFFLRRGMAHAQDQSFEQLLAAVEADNLKFPGAAGRIEGKEFETSSFAAAQPKVGKSSRIVGEQAIRMIVGFEVSGEKAYEQKYRKPIWPKGASGVTFGVGYDLGYTNASGLEEDWKDYLSIEGRTTLSPALGVKGDAAKQLLSVVGSVEVPFKDALKQFKEQTLPKYVALTENVLPNTSELKDGAVGALVSLTFNRGASYRIRKDEDPTGRYEEMREIRRLMREKKFSEIPEQIRKMKRIWQGNRDMAGLLTRREMEAELFQANL